jgi:Cd2+/Zn2+-exporting ATPase
MEKEYYLQGLECPHCASKIETAVKALNGVSSATVNLITATLKLRLLENYSGDIAADIEGIVHKFEPEVVVTDKCESVGSVKKHGGEADSTRGEIIQLAVGASVFGAGIALARLWDFGTYIELSVFLAAYAVLGGGVLLKAIKNILKGQVFDENFLMSVATIGAFAIGDFPEAVAIMLFYQVGEFFQNLAVRRSRKSITDLMDIRPDSATVKRGDELLTVAPEAVNIGEVIVVKPGEKIPLDGVVLDGESTLDTQALTGESVPRSVRTGDFALSGCINQTGVLSIEVVKNFGESTVSKIIDLVENAASRKAPTENFITTFSRYYTPAVVGLAALLAIIPPLFTGGAWSEWVHRGLIFLVISCPCALVISIPLGFFGGIGGASRKGVLVKGSNYLEALGNLDIVVFDKTGTLTKGVFKVTDTCPANGFSETELLEYAANAEAFSNHPIALSILRAYGKSPDEKQLRDYSEISGHGVRAIVNGRTVLAGNDKLVKTSGISFAESPAPGTKVYVSVDNRFAGCIVISDEIKEDSRRAIAGLKAAGIRKTVMLTGDNAPAAEAVAKELALDEVYSELLPDQKVEKVETLIARKRPKRKLAFVGDGINDAPVLARADVGIAMGGLGSDAAIEASDVVLMTDEPSKLLDAIRVAKATKRIVCQNIVFALGIKGIFLVLGAFGIAGLWEAVFADVGVSVLAVLNATRAMRAA